MTHETLKELVYLSYDREVSPSDQKRVKDHLAVCPECRNGLAAWQKTAAAFFSPSKIDSPDFFVQSVLRRIEEAPQEPSAFRWRTLLSGVRTALTPRRLILAGTAALAISALLISMPHRANQPSSEAAYEYASDLMGGPFAYAESEGTENHTAIEDYFL